VASVVGGDAFEVANILDLNVIGVKPFDHHVSMGKVISDLEELISVGPSDDSVQLCRKHLDRALEMLFVKVSHASQVHLTNLNFEEDLKDVPLPEE
jgi:hypothetical protein